MLEPTPQPKTPLLCFPPLLHTSTPIFPLLRDTPSTITQNRSSVLQHGLPDPPTPRSPSSLCHIPPHAENPRDAQSPSQSFHPPFWGYLHAHSFKTTFTSLQHQSSNPQHLYRKHPTQSTQHHPRSPQRRVFTDPSSSIHPSLWQRDKCTFPALLWAVAAAQRNRYSFTLVLK